MDSTEKDLILPPEYNLLPINALRMSSRRKIANYLNLEGMLMMCRGEKGEIDIVNNYGGLAELANFSYHEIMNIGRQRSPTEELLEQWGNRDHRDATIGNLWQYLYMMERFDVLKDCRRTILNDCRIYEENIEMERDAALYNLEQDPTVSNSEMKVDETRFATVHDVIEGHKTYYDAFVCYTSEDEEDRKFVRDIIKQLEVKRGLKLFVPGRDDLPGAAQHAINAYLIEVRCQRVLILISSAFLQSAVCDFQVKFAHALAPGARSKKLIPIVREKDTVIPRILRFLAVCDFSKADMSDWVWTRLENAIKAPMGPSTYFVEEDTRNPFERSSLKDIMFPSTRPLDDNKQNTDYQSDRHIKCQVDRQRESHGTIQKTNSNVCKNTVSRISKKEQKKGGALTRPGHPDPIENSSEDLTGFTVLNHSDIFDDPYYDHKQ